MRAMWYEHLKLTKEEAVARLNKDYAKDITIFNQIEKEALLMADKFSNGIISQFCL
jgi:CRISPR/Cas system-associated protein Cas10 (large subunit of type III CRISPR-Cas system)